MLLFVWEADGSASL